MLVGRLLRSDGAKSDAATAADSNGADGGRGGAARTNAADAGTFNILLFSRTTGHRHDSIPTALAP